MTTTQQLLQLARSEQELANAIDEGSARYVVLLREGAEPLEGALALVEEAIARFPQTELLYGDDDVVRRPVFSPVRLRGHDYLGQMLVLSLDRARALGGLRPEAGGAHGYDLALRFAAAGAEALSLPHPLVGHMPTEPAEAGIRQRIVAHHLQQLQLSAEIAPTSGGSLDLRYALRAEPLVSIIIPTRGSSATIAGAPRVLVVEAIRGILQRSTYRNVEFVVVADDETPQAVIDELRHLAGERLSLVRWSEPFNFSAKMNRGAVHARGDYLLMLNDDVELVSEDWIERLLGLAQQPGIGLVSGLLFFEDGSIQHGGHLYSYGQAGHIAIGWTPGADDPLGSMTVDREVSGATAACSLLSTDDFWAVGGFSTLFPGNYNDVDFCMKLRSLGKSVVWTPHVKLYHFESKTREATVALSELAALRLRWSRKLQVDPYWPAYVDDRR